MTRTDARRPDELITASGAAELMDVRPSAVSNYRKRSAAGRLAPRFPDAWLEIGRGAQAPIVLFVRAEIESWYADRLALAAERNARNVARLERQLAAARRQGEKVYGAGRRRGSATDSRERKG